MAGNKGRPEGENLGATGGQCTHGTAPSGRGTAIIEDRAAHGNPSGAAVRKFLAGCICAACHAPDTTGGVQGWCVRRDSSCVTFIICARCSAAISGSEEERGRLEQAIFAEFDRPDTAGRFFAPKGGRQS